MPDVSPMSAATKRAVFLSYASQDAEAATRICDALRAAGVEVWFDQSELRGGDAWDTNIRQQIGECALFVPVISEATQARREGYFRLEWKLADERTHQMAEGTPFILPVTIDATNERGALVPKSFLAVQWTKLPGGENPVAFGERVRKLLGGSAVGGALRPDESERPRESGHKAPPTKMHRASWWPWAIAAVAVIGVIGFLVTRKSEPPLPPAKPVAEIKSPASVAPVTAPAASDQSVAVLAFTNMSADKDTEYFSDGVSEEILNALANNPALRVAARTSSCSFKGKNATAEEIGRALHVAHVIEGSVRRSGNTVRITVQLINAADGYHAWSETFTKELTDIFAVQSEIAAKVVQKMSGDSAASTAPVVPLAAAPTQNLAAYDLYLRGRAAQTSETGSASRLEAVRLYEEALRLDPGYALASARLAQVIHVSRVNGYDRSEQSAARARTAALTAVRLDPNLPEAHLALALVRQSIDYDLGAAQRELDEAERLRPNDPEAPGVRLELEFARGHWGDALVALAHRAAELDPRNVATLQRVAINLRTIGRFAEADRRFAQGWALSQESSNSLRLRASNTLAWTGNLPGALAMLETIPEKLRDTTLFYSDRAGLQAMGGRFPAAMADYEQVRTFVASGRATTSGPRNSQILATYRSGQLEARLGRGARAAELYTEALAASRHFAQDFPDLPEGPQRRAIIHALRGEKSEARAAMAEATQLAARTHDAAIIAGVRRANAETLVLLGETAAAIAELRAVHEQGYAFGYLLRLQLEWEPLRGDAKFQQLMKEAEARADAQPRPKK